MEYNTFQHHDQTNFEGLLAQECTHMNDIVYHNAHTWMILYIICVQIKGGVINLPTFPIFNPKGLFFFQAW